MVTDSTEQTGSGVSFYLPSAGRASERGSGGHAPKPKAELPTLTHPFPTPSFCRPSQHTVQGQRPPCITKEESEVRMPRGRQNLASIVTQKNLPFQTPFGPLLKGTGLCHWAQTDRRINHSPVLLLRRWSLAFNFAPSLVLSIVSLTVEGGVTSLEHAPRAASALGAGPFACALRASE